eukprot:jgi/Botrbrau1/8365/Bobra.0046s0026.1
MTCKFVIEVRRDSVRSLSCSSLTRFFCNPRTSLHCNFSRFFCNPRTSWLRVAGTIVFFFYGQHVPSTTAFSYPILLS